MKRAFTLAEVLITLGIIGVVAALVLPNAINGYKRKQLEVQFKKTASLIDQAILNTKTEMGIDDFKDIISSNQNNKTALDAEFIEINEVFEKQFKYVKKSHNIDSGKVQHQEFFGQNRIYCNHFWLAESISQEAFYFYTLPDGSIISSIDYSPRLKEIHIAVDTNGVKGPNRRGYDIFLYGSNWACDPLMQASDNLVGCWPLALKNVNPVNKSYSYWDSLYRPKNYWEDLRNKK